MTAVDPQKLDAFMNRAVGDIGAALSAALVLVGDKLGLYKAMAGAGPLSSAQLAEKTGTHERYIREWLANQASGGYVDYDAASEKYTLPAEQAFALANEDSPALLAGAFQVIAAAWRDEPRITEAFKSGRGVSWADHDDHLFCGTERFFKSGYRAHLVSEWIPAIDGIQPKLQRGVRVADIGCGHGASTILMAQAFPKSTFIGFDFHAPSIQHARTAARRAGVAERVRFETALASEFAGEGYDFVTLFDCLHDMGDPVGAAQHVRDTLRPDGAVMIVEPLAGDRVEENLNPVGRVFYAASTMICVPNAISQGGAALGAQAGEKRLRDVLRQAGFTRIRRAAQTPFNVIIDARP